MYISTVCFFNKHIILWEEWLYVKLEFTDVVVTRAKPIIWSVPVALPTALYSKSLPFKVSISCTASLTLTWNNTWYVPISLG